MRIAQASTLSETRRAPATNGVVPLSEPQFQGNEWKYLQACLETGWVSSAGPFVEQFERAIAAYVGASHAVAVVNGTAALHIALKVAGVEPDDEVLVSDLTFIAPVNAIHYCGAHPILVDADPDTWQMDVDHVARFLAKACRMRGKQCYNRKTGRRIHAILPVHILGLACDIERIVEVARTYGLKVIEDAAEALGVRVRDRHVGTFSDLGVFSFNGNKIITTGGGGMVVTNDERLAESVRYLTTQAKDDDLESIHHEVGYNYRLTNLQAALGLAQLERLDEFVAKKCAIARAYERACLALDGITPMPSPPQTAPTYWLYTILLNEQTTLQQRKAVLRRLRDAGIGARPLWHPIHGLRPYRHCQRVGFRQASALYRRGVSLPSSVGLTQEDLDRCIETFRRIVSR